MAALRPMRTAPLEIELYGSNDSKYVSSYMHPQRTAARLPT